MKIYNKYLFTDVPIFSLNNLKLNSVVFLVVEIEVTKVFYMSSSFWLLGVESRDFSHAVRGRTACKAEEIHKVTIIFAQNGPKLSF